MFKSALNSFRIFILAVTAVILAGAPAWACSVCYGNPESKMSVGLKFGILSLLVILIGVLGTFGYFFFQISRRTQYLSAEQNLR